MLVALAYTATSLLHILTNKLSLGICQRKSVPGTEGERKELVQRVPKGPEGEWLTEHTAAHVTGVVVYITKADSARL